MQKQFSTFWLYPVKRDTTIARWSGAHRSADVLEARATARDIASQSPRAQVKNK